MTIASTAHLLLYVAFTGLLASLYFRKARLKAFLTLMSTMAVDIDHLPADLVYDTNRCSIGLHPLHIWPTFPVYLALAVFPRTRLIGLGLSLHMLLDFSDCAVQRGAADALSRVLSLP